MTLLGIALLLDHPGTVTWGGFVQNLVPVTLGNIVGGGVFVGGASWPANPNLRLAPPNTHEASGRELLLQGAPRASWVEALPHRLGDDRSVVRR